MFTTEKSPDGGLMVVFVSVLTALCVMLLRAGFLLYCMDIRQGQRAEYMTLFDGFSMVGKLIALNLLIYCYVLLWSMLFIIPGIIAMYRYRFAIYNLLDDPEISVFEALNRSKRQTMGYKMDLFFLDVTFLGWTLLENLPMLLLSVKASYAVMETAMSGGVMAGIAAMPALSPVAFLLCSLWSMAVQIYYLPYFTCTDLAYYDAAVRSSGHRTRPASPDGL